jgi:UDP-N-acetylmuramyl-tripeptide synthetase
MTRETILRFFKKLIPKRLFGFLAPLYHWFLAFLSALFYRFPSRKIFVLGVTGTKGKTSVLELVNAFFEEAGYKTALVSTLRFKIDKETSRNRLKMTMPGRFFIQRFLRRAVNKNCHYVFLEMTSQGVLQYRHKFISLDAIIFTNLFPEHLEAHGSFNRYREAKKDLFRALEKSFKKERIIIVNADDKNAGHFLSFKAEKYWLFGVKDLQKEENKNIYQNGDLQKIYVSDYRLLKDGIKFHLKGREFYSPLRGLFNLYNILAAVAFAKSQALGWEVIKRSLESFQGIPGRVEFIKEGQDFDVVVDYAHTPDSLEKLYDVFQRSRRICVLGSAGGGRDRWKRREMGRIADAFCDKIILTNEDPYDEDPLSIIRDIATGIASARYEILVDRKEAIAKALKLAQTGDSVLITGKGTDPWIMGPKGTKIKWDDREIAREELRRLLKTKTDVYGKA